MQPCDWCMRIVCVCVCVCADETHLLQHSFSELPPLTPPLRPQDARTPRVRLAGSRGSGDAAATTSSAAPAVAGMAGVWALVKSLVRAR
ncbi:hypothetical protein EON68_00835 [archaeon]|nr:MAG: hypothetical protein EON68_00835 [archaeon]